MSKAETIYCYECGEELKDHDVTYEIGNGEFICESCRDNYYYCCDDCYELIHFDDTVAVDYNDRYVCRECADNYYMCDHCDNLFSDRHIAINTIQITLCDYCYSEYYFTCAGCGDVYHQDNGEYINGYDYCSTCADDHRICILSYSTKPNPMFFGGNAGYGLEVEIDDGDDKQNAARDIQAAGNDHIYLKEDGSLSYKGMEIVTHPATLNYHVTTDTAHTIQIPAAYTFMPAGHFSAQPRWNRI